MSSTPTISDMMAACAEDAVDHARSQGGTLDFSHESVRSVAELLARMHEARPKGLFSRLISRGPSQELLFSREDATAATSAKSFGAHQVGSGISIKTSFRVSPLSAFSTVSSAFGLAAKAGKRLINGPEDNVWHYFQVVARDWPVPSNNALQRTRYARR